MFFDSWPQLGRVLLLGAAAYVALLVLLRLSGKRTLAKLNAFDLVVTVALGSTLATVLLSSEVSLTEGVLAFAVLVAAQFVVAFTAVRVPAVRRAVKAEPTLLLRDGQMLRERLLACRISEGEVRQAVRASGQGSLSSVAAVVLETDGSVSVIPVADEGDGSALADVDLGARAGRTAPDAR